MSRPQAQPNKPAFEQACDWSEGYLEAELTRRGVETWADASPDAIGEAYADSVGMRPQGELRLSDERWDAAWDVAERRLAERGRWDDPSPNPKASTRP